MGNRVCCPDGNGRLPAQPVGFISFASRGMLDGLRSAPPCEQDGSRTTDRAAESIKRKSGWTEAFLLYLVYLVSSVHPLCSSGASSV